MAERKKKTLVSASELKSELWDNIKQLKCKKLDAKTANSIATQSRELIRVVKTELELCRLLQTKPEMTLLPS